MSKKLLALLALVSLALSCQKELLEESPNPQREPQNNKEEFLVFDNRSSLDQAVGGEVSSDLRGISIQGFRNGESLKNGLRSVTNTPQSEVYEELVPEAEFRTLLNSRGEIQVGDTVYCIAKAGTFFAHRKHLAELRSTVLNYVEQENSNPSSLFINLGDITLYRTFEGVDFDTLEPIQDNKDGEEQEDEELRSTEEDKYKDLDFSKFPRERASRQTWFGKLLQSTVIRKSLTAVYPNHSKRRFNCAVFDYNYLIRNSIGITAKIQKKMWYGGWGKLQNIGAGDIIVGCRHALIKVPYPEELKDKGIENMVKNAPRYPENKYEQYIRTLPYPSWFETKLVNTTLPVIGNIDITLRDAIALTADRVKVFMKQASKINDHPLADNSKAIDEILNSRTIDTYRTVTVPIYTQGSLFIYIRNTINTNSLNNAEVTMRFSDRITEGTLGIITNTNFDFHLKDFKPTFAPSVNLSTLRPHLHSVGIANPHLRLEISEPKTGSMDLIDGEFFAAGRFHGVWTGYNLYW